MQAVPIGLHAYEVAVISGNKRYNIEAAVEGLTFSDQTKQLAQSVSIQCLNVVADGKRLSELIEVRSRVFIWAHTGDGTEEVFRGFVWAKSFKDAQEEESLELKCYDNLIYLQESEEAAYFPSGTLTVTVLKTLCDSWGITMMNYYTVINHGKLVLRGKLADIIMADVLDVVKAQTGKPYVVRSERDVMYIRHYGSNETIYHFGVNTMVATSGTCTMDGMVTKVVILGKADKEGRPLIEATEENNTDKYGTIQKIIDRDDDVTIADATEEAKSILKENSTPKWEYELKAPNIPGIRKGDKVSVSAKDISGYYYVTGIDRTIDSQKSEMVLSLEKAS